MRVNNLMKQKYVEEVGDRVLEWVVKSLSIYNSSFAKLCKDYFNSIGKSAYLQLAIAIKMHNLCRDNGNNTLTIPEIGSFFKSDPLLKLKDEEYSGYLIHNQSIGPNNLEGQCDRFWNHIT